MGIAAVTGSASGIGAAVCARLEQSGDRVIGVDLRDAGVVADLSSSEGRRAAIAGVREACGGTLDRLVVAAGLGAHLDAFGTIASVNYFGAIELLDGLRECLERGSRPAAVAVCSNAAQIGGFDEQPAVLAMLDHDETRTRELLAGTNGFLAYGGSKHALCRALRRRAGEWGAVGVRLNGIAPGPTRTPMMDATLSHPVFGRSAAKLDIPLGRMAEPAEIAATIAFLLGPEAAYIHGSIVYADGGNDAAVRPDRF